MNPPVVHPEPRQVVERASVDRLVAAADREVSQLEAEAAQARAAADEAEARVGSHEPDELGAAWLMLQVERFVQQLRGDASVEAADVVYEAETRARAMVEEARLQPRGSSLDGSVPGPPPATPDEAAPAPGAEAVPAPVPASSPESSPATPEAPSAERPPQASIEDPFALIARDDFTGLEPSVSALAPLDSGFWPVEEPRKRRFRTSRSVALTQALAVGLVAAAAVVHFA